MAVPARVHFANTLLLLCEQMEDAMLPEQRNPEAYITPVIAWMSKEWVKVKQDIADIIVTSSSRIGATQRDIFKVEDGLSQGLLIRGKKVVSSAKLLQILTEAKKKIGKLGSGKCYDAKGKEVDIFFDEFTEDDWRDMKKNWDFRKFENASNFGFLFIDPGNYKAMVAKDAKGKVHGGCIYTAREGNAYIEGLETAPFNRGKGKGLSGVGSNLLGRVGKETSEGGKLSLISTGSSKPFYEKIGMTKAKGMDFEFTSAQAQSFADKLGISKTEKRAKPVRGEEVGFTKATRNTTRKTTKKRLDKYKTDTGKEIRKAVSKAKADTIPTIMRGTPNATSVKLSQAGLRQAVQEFEFQKSFVDDISKDTLTRVDRLMGARYTDKLDLRTKVNREFRIDRDQTLAKFHSEVRGHAEQMMGRKITSEQFQNKMQGTIDSYYRRMYKEGKQASLTKADKEYIAKEAESQAKYLSNFGNSIDQQDRLGKDLTSRITQRAGLYAERGTALFEAGHVSSLPDDVLLDWVLQPAEHCRVCPSLAAGSPYTKGELPGYPGEREPVPIRPKKPKKVVAPKPEPEEILQRDVAPKPKPTKIQKEAAAPDSSKVPFRVSKGEVEYKGKSYTEIPGVGYSVINRNTGLKTSIDYGKLPSAIRTEFGKEFTGVGKVVVPKPKKKIVTPRPEPPVPKKKVVKPPVQVLTADDIKSLDIGVKRAAKVPVKSKTIDDVFAKGEQQLKETTKRSAIRAKTLQGMGISPHTIKEYDGFIDDWAASSESLGATKMCVMINRLEGKKDTFGLSEKMSWYLKNQSEEFVFEKDMVKCFASMRHFNSQTLAQIKGKDTISAYRGVSGKYADDCLAAAKKSTTNTIRVPVRPLFSETEMGEIAEWFVESTEDAKGVIFKRTMNIKKEVVESNHTSVRLAQPGIEMCGESPDELVSFSKSGFIDAHVSEYVSQEGGL